MVSKWRYGRPPAPETNFRNNFYRETGLRVTVLMFLFFLSRKRQSCITDPKAEHKEVCSRMLMPVGGMGAGRLGTATTGYELNHQPLHSIEDEGNISFHEGISNAGAEIDRVLGVLLFGYRFSFELNC